jgi:hypothetical protein
VDEYRILAEHFGKSENVRVIVSGKVAKIEGDTIYLPEDVPAEVQGVLLATLLHESYHLRFTDRANVDRLVEHQEHKKNVLEALEDMRLNAKVFEDWPNAKNLYADLHEYHEEKHGAEFAALPWQVQAMRKLMYQSYGDPALFDRFASQDPKVLEWWAKHGEFAQSVIDRAKAAPDTEALVPLVNEILTRLFPEDERRKQARQQAEQEQKQAEQEAGQARDGQRDAQGQGKAAHQKAKDLDNQAREQEKDAAREKAQAKQDEQEAESREQAGDKKGAEQKRKQAQEHKQKADEHQKKAEDLNKQAAPNYKALEDLKKQYDQQKAKAEKADAQAGAAKAEQAKLDQEAQGEQQDGMDGLSKVGIGFNQIDPKDFTVRHLLPENIEDEVLEFLKSREQRTLNTDQGRIDPRRLPQYYQPENLFLTTLEDAHKKTRIYFLVDVSGSMSERLNGDGGREKHVLSTEAVLAICKAVEKGKAEGLDLEYGIFGFDTEAHEVKGFEQELDTAEVKKGLAPQGGTTPWKVIEHVETQHQPDNASTKQVVFMVSDGEFGSQDYNYIEQRLGGSIKWVFLGIDANDRYDARCRDLFGKYNVRRAQDLKKSLGRALIDNLD